MARIIAYDPDLKIGGVAVIDLLNNKISLVYLDIIRIPKCTEVGAIVKYWGYIGHMIGESYNQYGEIYVEQPVIYNKLQQKGNPNDILRLGMVAGALGAAHYAIYVTPQQWKGNTPKGINHARTLKACPEAEKRLKGIAKTNREHPLDALGIALWAAKEHYGWKNLI